MAIDIMDLTIKLFSPKGIFGTTNTEAVKDVLLEAFYQEFSTPKNFGQRLEAFLYEVSRGLDDHSDVDKDNEHYLVAQLDMGGHKSKVGIELSYELNGEVITINSPIYMIQSSTLKDKVFGDKWHQMQIYVMHEEVLHYIQTFKTGEHLRVDLFETKGGGLEDILLCQSVLFTQSTEGFQKGKPMTITNLRFFGI
jgi:hypothetical protein